MSESLALTDPAPLARRDPAGSLLAIFDALEERVARPGWSVGDLLEAAERARPEVELLAAQAGVVDAERLAGQWQILMGGSIVAAGEGDVRAARRAQGIGALMLRRADRPGGPGS